MPHSPIMRRVSAVATPGGVFIRRQLVGVTTKIVWGQFINKTTAPSSQHHSKVLKGNDPEEPSDDREARLHHVAAPIGQLPLGDERAVVARDAYRC